MSPTTRETLRRLMLAGSGVIFLGIGLAAIAFPVAVARQYGLALPDVNAMNQFRAIVNGFWFGLAALMITAARRPDLPLLGDLCGWMILLQAVGRSISFALDGVPGLPFVGAFLFEATGGGLILLLHPAGTRNQGP